eukprot:scaffold33273_cov62-Phaeocystis_antarctica.AAC.8
MPDSVGYRLSRSPAFARLGSGPLRAPRQRWSPCNCKGTPKRPFACASPCNARPAPPNSPRSASSPSAWWWLAPPRAPPPRPAPQSPARPPAQSPARSRSRSSSRGVESGNGGLPPSPKSNTTTVASSTNQAKPMTCTDAKKSPVEIARHAPTQPVAMLPTMDRTKTW